MYTFVLKRMIDLLLSSFLILILIPVMILTALLIRLEDCAPAIFKQIRVGKNNIQFTIYKFRSMPFGACNVSSAEAYNVKFTLVGRIIRRTNIDELPQLFNILFGQMSFVGPRAALPTQFSLVKMRKNNGVYRAFPGLTGLAQVNSYDGMSDEEKVKWDSKYVKKISFVSDVAIIFRTFGYLLRKPPVY